jgi:hypothetical protein
MYSSGTREQLTLFDCRCPMKCHWMSDGSSGALSKSSFQQMGSRGPGRVGGRLWQQLAEPMANSCAIVRAVWPARPKTGHWGSWRCQQAWRRTRHTRKLPSNCRPLLALQKLEEPTSKLQAPRDA